MRPSHSLRRLGWLLVAAASALILLSGTALAQIVEVTPSPTETFTSKLSPGTQWVYWMAIGGGVIGVLVVVGFLVSYLRFAPKFYGREPAVKVVRPGARPESLVRQAAAMRYTPPPTHVAPPAVPSARPTATATAVAERPAPPAAPEAEAAAPEAAAPEAEAAAPEAEAAAPEAAASEAAGPEAEAAASEDAGPEAEAAAPEAAAPEAEAAAPEAAAPEAEAAAPAAPEAPAAPAPAPTRAGAVVLDQETFDRVLQEQLDKGVDRRVAEGRARAAAVVAARKKAQA